MKDIRSNRNFNTVYAFITSICSIIFFISTFVLFTLLFGKILFSPVFECYSISTWLFEFRLLVTISIVSFFTSLVTTIMHRKHLNKEIEKLFYCISQKEKDGSFSRKDANRAHRLMIENLIYNIAVNGETDNPTKGIKFSDKNCAIGKGETNA